MYLIKEGKRFGFRNEFEFFSHGYNFSQVVEAHESDLLYPFLESQIIKAKVGSLILDRADNRTVYIVTADGVVRAFPSLKVFLSKGYTFKNILKINLSDYHKDPIIQ